jgi:hypothetical protein
LQGDLAEAERQYQIATDQARRYEEELHRLQTEEQRQRLAVQRCYESLQPTGDGSFFRP